MAEPLAPHPDRLFPADPATRDIARQLHASVAAAPIFSPHGHVDAAMLLADEPFADAAALLVTPDHYVTRVLHSLGVDLADLGVGGSGADPRETWRIFSAHWSAYLGTPSRYWLESELAFLGVTEPPSAENADAVFGAIGQRLREPQFTPRALFERFAIDVLATTDDPCSDLAAHAALAGGAGRGTLAAAGRAGRVIPTFRPDRYLDPAASGWLEGIGALTEASGREATSYSGYLDALRARRRHFIDHGATATDHGVPDAGSEPLDAATAARLHGKALAGTITADEATAYRRNMLFEMARMSTEDGLVMQLHPGILRNHDRATFARFGGDTGHDLPLSTSFSEPLRPLLEEFGNDPRFRIVLFTVDETAFSRDIAPLAGYYPSVFVGAPWWFLDAPDAIGRFRSAAVETAGFAKMAGFVDDTRAFCSIPARHDMSRRSDAAFLARLVVEHRMSLPDALTTIENLVVHQPRRVFTRTVAD